MSRCKVCGEVNKHLVADAVKGTIACGKCGHGMDMRGATIEAVAESKDARSISMAAD
jgi:transcription initiation factor TFIIIB Brf1 subunit/transcription initiation factor TFIIB